MPIDVLILIVTGVLAVVALIAAVISVRNLREVKRALASAPHQPTAPAAVDAIADSSEAPVLLEPAPEQTSSADKQLIRVEREHVEPEHAASGQELVPHHGQVARVVEGKVVVTPTRSQVAHAIMGQPRVRFAIWMTGIAHALRPESRDRILGMMRRDYRDRRRHRESAARAALRSAHSPATRAEEARGQ